MNKQLISTLALSFLLAACGGDSSKDDKSQQISSGKGGKSQTFNLDFAAKINSATLACGANTETVGTAQTPADIKYFGMYISELQVASTDGKFLPVTLAKSTTADVERGISLLAFCGTSLKNSKISGTVATDAKISQVRFTVGVPEKYNHLDATKTEGILSKAISMNWGWTAGYKHARMDVVAGGKAWNIHLGSTACTGKADGTAVCSKGNRPTYTFNNIDLAQEKIEFDYADLVMNSDVTKNTDKTPPGCMSKDTDPECGNVFTALGLDLATGSCKNNDCDSQKWVSTAKK